MARIGYSLYPLWVSGAFLPVYSQNQKFEDAAITTADQYAKNGLLHIIDKAAPALSNAWEFVQSNTLMPSKQKTFMLSQTDSTGANAFLRNVYDLRDEKKQFTFFVLTDTSWDAVK